MSLECQYCNKIITNKSNLIKHQKTAKNCIKIQQEMKVIDPEIIIEIKSYDCEYCNKKFSSKNRLNSHIETCKDRFNHIIQEKINENNNLIYMNEELKTLNSKLKIENDLLKQEDFRDDLRKSNNELIDKLKELALASIDQKNELIAGMIKKYVKKQPRQKFDEQNVIYILTTQLLQKDRRYILGKAKNLTNRLSTYNKTDEHEVIFYQVCGDEDIMNLLEPLVFKKLEEYREQANRERFILPEDKNIDFFKDTVKNCFEFLK